MSDEKPMDPKVDWVHTTTASRSQAGNPTVGGTPGSGANDITGAGLPNADPDGYDYDRTDLEGVHIGDAEQYGATSGPPRAEGDADASPSSLP